MTKPICLLAAMGFLLAIAGCGTPPPPNKFVSRVRNGQPVYLYSDPAACNCVYLGTQQNWDVYQQQLAARRMAKEEVSAAESQAEWDFGAWGW